MRMIVSMFAIGLFFGILSAQDAPPNAGLHVPITSYIAELPERRWKHVIDTSKWREDVEIEDKRRPLPRVFDEVRIVGISRPTPTSVLVTTRLFPFSDKSPPPSLVRYFALRKVGADWQIDWPATVGHNPTTLQDFRKRPPKEPVVVRVFAELQKNHDAYFDDYLEASPTHYAFRLVDTDGASVFGYLPKDAASVDLIRDRLEDKSSSGNVIFRFAVEIAPAKESSNVCAIKRIVSKTWLIDEAAPKDK